MSYRLNRISEQFQKERKLRIAVEEQLETVFNLSSDLFVIFAQDGTIKRANQGFIHAVDYTGQKTIGDILIKAVHPEDLDIALRALRHISQGGSGGVQFRIIRNSDYNTLTSWSIVALANNTTLAVGRLIGTWIGDSESFKKVGGRAGNGMMSLWQSREMYFKAFQGNPTMMFMKELEGPIIDVNEAFCKATGYTRSEAIGRDCVNWEFFRNPEMPHLLKTFLVKNRRIDNYPVEFWDKSGDLHQGRLWGQTLDFGGKPCHLSCIVDMTDQIRIENEMKRLDRLRLVGEMAASLGHEIRNPMTTIRGFLQLLIENNAYEEDRCFFDLMIEELDRTNEIISAYLSLVQDKPIDLQPRHLDQVVKSIYPMILADANYREMSVNLDLARLPQLHIDEKEVRQLIINLARNGLEAMAAGGTLTIGTRAGTEQIILYVKDEGPGLDPVISEQIGIPFQTTKDDGTGLGLSICFSIAARHLADIDYITGPDGTTFFVRFPCP